MITTVRESLEKINKNLSIIEHANLSQYTTIKTGGPADFLIMPQSIEEIQEIFTLAQKIKLPITILGKGSNTLISDKGIRGLVISTLNLDNITIEDTQLTAQCGALLSNCVLHSYRNGYTGLEAFSGIPGTIGGAVYGNAGAYGMNLSDVIIQIDYLQGSGEVGTLKINEKVKTHFGYRRSIFKESSKIILSAVLALKKADSCNLKLSQSTIRGRIAKRQAAGHYSEPSFGSVYKNPEGMYAGQLIESTLGPFFSYKGVCCSVHHANRLTYTKQGVTSQDILNCMEMIETSVLEKTGVLLDREVQLLGDW